MECVVCIFIPVWIVTFFISLLFENSKIEKRMQQKLQSAIYNSDIIRNNEIKEKKIEIPLQCNANLFNNNNKTIKIKNEITITKMRELYERNACDYANCAHQTSKNAEFMTSSISKHSNTTSIHCSLRSH